MMQAPWRFDGTYPLVDQKEISLEIQINASSADGSGRSGVLKWYNTVVNTYQNASALAPGILDLAGGTLPSARPAITTQPKGAVKAEGTSVTLTAAATASDGGTLSYEWFKADSSSAAGTSAGTGTGGNASLTVDVEDAPKYYYVVFTNTKGALAPNSVKSNVAALVPMGEQTLPENWIDKVTIRNTNAPVYGFDIGTDTFGDYDQIKVSLKFDAASSDLSNRRLRAWGNYDYDTWTVVTNRPGMGNDGTFGAGGRLLNEAQPTAYTAGAWADYTIELSSRDKNADKDIINASKGVILLAFAPVPPGGGSGTTIFYVKNLTLESSTDATKKVKALHPEDIRLWGGEGAGAYVTQNGADVVDRQVYPLELVTPADSRYNAEKGGFVGVTGGTAGGNDGYGSPQYEFTAPDDLSLYSGFEVRYKIEEGTVPGGPNDTDFYFGAGGLSDEYNATTMLKDALNQFEGMYFDLDAYFTAKGTPTTKNFTIKYKPAQSGVNNGGKTVLVTSVQLILK